MKRKPTIPQFEFNWGPEPFRLVQEETTDGERVTREQRQKERDQDKARRNQTIFAVSAAE